MSTLKHLKYTAITIGVNSYSWKIIHTSADLYRVHKIFRAQNRDLIVANATKIWLLVTTF